MFGRNHKGKKSVDTNPIETYMQWAARPTDLADIKHIQSLLQQKECQDFYQWAASSSENGQTALIQLADDLAQMDVFQSALAAHLCGALIEQGAADEQAARKIVAAFAQQVKRTCEFLAAAQDRLGCTDEDFAVEKLDAMDMEALFTQKPDTVRAFWGCDLITLAAMAVITRDHGARQYLRQLDIYPYVQYLAQFKDTLQYVDEVLKACMHLPLTILSPKTRHGLRVEVNDLSNCFHLFTLLEAELCRQGWLEDFAIAGYVWNEAIYQMAAGIKHPSRNESIKAHLQYYTVHAVLPDGSYQVTRETAQGTQIDPETLVWGEMPPEAIPLYNDERVIIVDREGMFAGRSWDVAFIAKCHDALSPSLQVTEVLSEADCRQLWDSIRKNGHR